MGTRRAKAPAAFFVFLVAALLLSGSSAFGVFAQIGGYPPLTGHVIAHGIDTMPGASAAWRLGIVTAPPPGIDATFGSFDTGFAIGWEQPLIATQLPSATSTYLEPGQAVFHPGTSTMRVTSTTGVAEGFVSIDLTTDPPAPGASWIGEPFTAPSGTRDVRLTSDLLAAGACGTFVPDNDLPYMVYAFSGALQVTDENGANTELMAGDAMQLVSTASLLAGATASAHWMIASIGPAVSVPPLPTPVTTSAPAATGSLVVHLLQCPDGTDPLIAPTECSISDIVWDVTISPQGNDSPDAARTLVNDAVDIGDTSYRFSNLPPGTWVIQPDMSWMTPEQRIEITGDIVPLGGIWGAEVTTGQESEINVYVIDPHEQTRTGTGSLTIEMYDCPPGTDPLVDPAGCTLATDVPNVEVSRITQSEMIVYNSAWDAVSPEVGVFILQDIPSGLFMLIPEDGGLWSADAITMGGDAFWDTGFWQVDVPDGGSVYVSIFFAPPATAEPTQVTDVSQGIGRLWITQIDCPPGTDDPLAEPACVPSEAPWEVTITDVETGETWSLYEHATLAMTGSWEFTLPAGSYYIDVYYDESWQVIYETFATVSEGGLSEVVVYSIAPGEP